MKTKALIFVALLSIFAGSASAQKLSGIGGGTGGSGTCSTCVIKASNLSDVASAATSLANLGGAPAGLTSVVTSSPATITVAQWAACMAFVPNAGSLTITLPLSSTLSNNGCIEIDTINAVTLALANGADKIVSGAGIGGAGSSLSLLGNQHLAVRTDAAGFFYVANNTGSAFSSPVTIAVVDSKAGATSAPAWVFTGAPFAGNGTTSMPLLDINVSGSTARTGQNTSGTLFGMNAADAFGGYLMDLSKGGTSKFIVGNDGSATAVGSFTTGAGSFMTFSGRTLWTSPVDGEIMFQNAAQTGFTRMEFGGNTSSFPALTRSSTELQVKLADDSLFANLGYSSLISRGATPTLTGTCTTGSKVGGQAAGTFTATCTAQTVIVTFTTTAPNGWACRFQDRTTPADIINQASSTTTSCTTASTTTTASDVVQWTAVAY